MRLAGMYSNGFLRSGELYATLNDVEKMARDWGAEYQLESYHYISKPQTVEKIRRDGVRLFLDSGAFSAWTKNVTIDRDAYIRFIQEGSDFIEVASVLDGIGDAQLTYENQMAMERAGCAVLPCFHQGEDERYLEYYLSRYEFITLGGMVGAHTQAVIRWLDRIFEKYLTDGSGRVRCRVHGFGLTSPEVMLRYPWHSVDSTSWVMKAAYGTVMIPELGRVVPISSSSPASKQHDQHMDTYDDLTREQIDAYIRAAGFDPDRLRSLHGPRWAFNCYAYRRLGELSKKAEDFIFKRPEQELF